MIQYLSETLKGSSSLAKLCLVLEIELIGTHLICQMLVQQKGPTDLKSNINKTMYLKEPVTQRTSGDSIEAEENTEEKLHYLPWINFILVK